MLPDAKRCTLCRELKPAASFSIQTAGGKRRPRLHSYCRPCAVTRPQRNPRTYFSSTLAAIRSCPGRATLDPAVTPELLIQLFDAQRGRCALTGMLMSLVRGRGHLATNASIDRIDSAIGYTPTNIQLVTFWANLAKGSLTAADFITYCARVAERGRPLAPR